MIQDTTRPRIEQHSTATHVCFILSALLAITALGNATGPIGVVLAPAIAVAWYFHSPIMAFAIGQVVFVALFPEEGTLNVLALGEVGLGGVLLSPILDHSEPIRAVVTLLCVSGVLGAITGAGVVSGGLWLGALGLITSVVIAAYVIHRYERVALGLVEVS